jgi:hypothetical protein
LGTASNSHLFLCPAPVGHLPADAKITKVYSINAVILRERSETGVPGDRSSSLGWGVEGPAFGDADPQLQVEVSYSGLLRRDSVTATAAFVATPAGTPARRRSDRR